jgi:sigma-B regulation protein RsbU (phosphoserine phosphatase)
MRWLLGWLVLGCCIASPQLSASQPDDPPRVLVLNSYSAGFAWTDHIVDGIKSVFADEEDLTLRMEFMDTKYINTDAHYSLLRDLYRNKFDPAEFDVIIATDDDALIFLRKYRSELFPGTPVVFCGVNNFTPHKVAGFDRFTGVNEEPDMASTIEVILRLLPNTHTINVITDTLTTGLMERRAVERIVPQFSSRKLAFNYIDNVSMGELQATLAALEPGNVGIFISFFMDSDGIAYTPREALSSIINASAIPIFGASDYQLGDGVVGGMMRSSRYQGEVAARLAKRVLSGEPISSIPVVQKSPNAYMFDYQQLKRFDIDLSLLPEGSILINEPETFYYKYKQIIFSVLAIMVILVAYIVVLLFNINKRKRAQNGLRKIIDASTSVFQFHTPDVFLSGLRGQLKSLIDANDDAIFLKANQGACVGGEQLLVVDMPPGDGTPLGAPDNYLDRQEVRHLLEQAVKNNKTVFSKDKLSCAVVFDNHSLPSNLVYLQSKSRFDDLDVDLLEIFASTVSMAFNNLEKQKIEESLEMARQIQMSMLPHHFDEFTNNFGIDLHALVKPAKEVAGDFYDFFAIDDNHLCFVVGDVSGKGVPASLFMAMTKTLIRSASENNPSPEKILFKVNNELARDNEQMMFVTVIIAILDNRSGEMQMSNAGHNPPYLLSKGVLSEVGKQGGAALGIMPDEEYAAEAIRFVAGDRFFAYSDGITEAFDSDGVMFEEARLEEALKGIGDLSSAEFSDGVLEKVDHFVRGAPQSDDITLLNFRLGRQCRPVLQPDQPDPNIGDSQRANAGKRHEAEYHHRGVRHGS